MGPLIPNCILHISKKTKKILSDLISRKKTTARIKLLNPEEVRKALIENSEIIKWLEFISNHYNPPRKKILLIYPCTATKPYHNSRSYKVLFKTLSSLKEKRNDVHLMTISEPFGLIPEEFYEKNWNYDCPGLFEWWCKRNGQTFSKEALDESVEILGQYVAKFLKKIEERKCYSKIIAFVRTYSSQLKKRHDHTHRRIIERASQISGVKVDILPPRELVLKIVKERGKFAWDMFGVAHPIAQKYLLNYLKGVLHEEN